MSRALATKGIRWLLALLVCVVAAEIAARSFWRLCYGVPFSHPGRILYAYYPELREVDRVKPTREDAAYDVLLLGGSVLHRDWGSIEQGLHERLTASLRRPVRIFNLSARGHTSRDSRLKYEALGEARFELVIFYHGINESRMNNAPPAVFQEDYSHFPWYGIVNLLAPYHGVASFALPYTVRWSGIRARYISTGDRSVASGFPRKDWIQYGKDSPSAVSFEHNLGRILELATRRGDRVLLMTFAIYVPPDYSQAAFEQKRLDYGLHTSPIEIWGRPEHVVATVGRQDEVVRRLAAGHAGTLFVDQARLMVGSGRYFNDPCHLTVLGSSMFVENLLRGLLPEAGTD
jgi:hypothetical protein